MPMNFRTLPASKVENLNRLQTLEHLSELTASIDREFGNMKYADQVLDNVRGAIEALKRYGDADAAAIAICNVDHALEALTQKQLKDITSEVAVEALGEAEKSGWQKFKDAVVAIIEKILSFLRALFTSTNQKIKYLKDLTEWTPSDKQYAVVTKEKAKTLSLMATDIDNYIDWMQNRVYQVKDTFDPGSIANEADVKVEEILKKYPEFVAKKEGEQFPMLTFVGADNILSTTTLGEAGYSDINRVKVFIADINVYIMNVVQRGIAPLAAKIVRGMSNFIQWVGTKASDPNISDTGKLIRNFEVSAVECFKIQAKVSAILARTITAIYTDAHGAKPETSAAPAA